MGRYQSSKRTYSKVPAQPADKQPHRRQRKIIPKFNDLFLAKDENTQPDNFSDIFDFISKKHERSKDAPENQSSRKPLAVSSFLTNSTLGSTGHVSINDTFDKFTKQLPRPHASHVIGCTSSTSGASSSFDVTGVLYKSLPPESDSRLANSTGLRTGNAKLKREQHSVFKADNTKPKALGTGQKVTSKDVGARKQNYRKNCQSQVSRQNEPGHLCSKQHASPQLFSDDDNIVVSGNKVKRTASKRYGHCSTEKCRDKVSSITDEEQTSVKNDPTYSLKQTNALATVISTDKEALTAEDAKHSPWIRQLFSTLCSGLFTAQKDFSPKLSAYHNVLPNQHTLSSEKQMPQSPENSYGSAHSGKVKIPREICTSTPAENSRNQNVLRKGSHWSLQASPSLENAVSPVPRQSSMVIEEHSSVFESPECLKTQSKLSPLEIRSCLTSGSKYETCKDSYVDISSKIPRVIIGDSDSDKENSPKSPGSFYNTSRVLNNGPFKGACIPAFELAGSALPKGTPLGYADCITTTTTKEVQIGVKVDSSIVVGRRGQAAALNAVDTKGDSQSSRRKTSPIFSSPDPLSPRKNRHRSILLKQVKHSVELNSPALNCLGNPVDTDSYTSRDLIEQEHSLVLRRKIVNKRRGYHIPRAHTDCKSSGDSPVSKTSQATEDSAALAGRLTSDTSHLSSSRQSPILTRKRAKVRLKQKVSHSFSSDMFHKEDTSDDGPSPPKMSLREHVKINSTNRKAAARCKRLAVKPVVTCVASSDEDADARAGGSSDATQLPLSRQSLIMTRRQARLGFKRTDCRILNDMAQGMSHMGAVSGDCLLLSKKSHRQHFRTNSSLGKGATRRSRRLARKSIATSLASVTEDPDMLAAVTNDTSQFFFSRQSPILDRKQGGIKSRKVSFSSAYDTSCKGDISGDTLPPSRRSLRQRVKINSPLGKVATRKSKRQSMKSFVTTRPKQNQSRKLSFMEFSSLSVSQSCKKQSLVKSSETSVDRTSKLFVSETSENNTGLQNANSINRFCQDDSIKEDLDFDVKPYLHNTLESVSDCINHALRNESVIDVHTSLNQAQSRNSVRSDTASRKCVNVKLENENLVYLDDKVIYKKNIGEKNDPGSLVSQKCVLDSAEEGPNVSLQLEEELGSLPSFCATPAKPGKGWKRSLRSMIPVQGPDVEESDCLRRETLHCLAALSQRSSLRISAIPLEMGQRKKQVVPSIRGEINRRSSLQITYLDHDTRSAVIIPPDPRDRVLSLCSQVQPVPLTDCFTESRLACCKKIGEGVYGEVFMTRPNPANLEGATVLKVMPIEGDFDVNGEPQKKFEEILSEIIISMELSNLRSPDQKQNWTENYVHLLNCWCVQGSYHQDLLQLWDQFNEERGSENDRPDIFPDTQLYVVLEFGHGGGDLESYVFNNARDAYAIFLQVAYSLAVAEQELEFEHRDLHWGNVLVAPTREATLEFKVNSESYVLRTHGLKATVIDFTLSRLKTQHCVVYNNLAEDPSLFIAEGDYQFEIYRQMKKTNGNEWEKFTPYSNVLWLHYLLDKMMTECYYRNTKAKLHTTHLATLAHVKGKILGYESATHFVLSRELEACAV